MSPAVELARDERFALSPENVAEQNRGIDFLDCVAGFVRNFELLGEEFARTVDFVGGGSAFAESRVMMVTTENDAEKVVACKLALAARAHYVKTSTGFSTGGATLFDVALMRETVGPGVGVKAAGGIKNTEDARRMIEAGATRLGASAGIQIIQGQASEGSPSGGY